MNTMRKDDGNARWKGRKGNFTHPKKFEQVIFALPFQVLAASSNRQGLGAEASESQTVNQVCAQWMVASRRATYGATTLKSAV